ncbi:MAG TPA: chemotaxis protein CheD [Thermoanaerobaculia bacterium]|nr:chemotaxis protein CheD [Thermoanaerobaculia bacterium]
MAEPLTAPRNGKVPKLAAGGRQVPSVYLYPGELIATSDPSVISTVLGSCVCVCLLDPVTRSGGANHFLLPHLTRGDGSSCRFGGTAMEALISRMLSLGCQKRNLTARIFGGASQFEVSSGRISIGLQNVHVATRFLEDEGIPIVAQEVGGARGRKLVFHTETGDVFVKTL